MKSLEVVTFGNLYKLAWQGGGEMPKELKGLYTNPALAREAGEAYLTQREKDAKNNTRKK